MEVKGERVEELLLEFDREFGGDRCSFTSGQIERLAQLFREFFNNAKREGMCSPQLHWYWYWRSIPEDMKAKIGLAIGGNVVHFAHPRYPNKLNFEAALLLRSLTVVGLYPSSLTSHFC